MSVPRVCLLQIFDLPSDSINQNRSLQRLGRARAAIPIEVLGTLRPAIYLPRFYRYALCIRLIRKSISLLSARSYQDFGRC
jgi:hypothetical protein